MTAKKTKAPKTSVRKTKDVRRAAAPLRASKYDWYLDKVSKLEKGQALVGWIPKGTTPRQMQTRLASIEDRRDKQGLLGLPEGYRLAHYETEEGDIAVELVKKK